MYTTLLMNRDERASAASMRKHPHQHSSSSSSSITVSLVQHTLLHAAAPPSD